MKWPFKDWFYQKILLIAFLNLCILSEAPGQFYDPPIPSQNELLKSRSYQIRTSDSDEWTEQRRYLYAYDGKGREILNRTLNRNNNWLYKEREEIREYNNYGYVTMYHSIRYGQNGAVVSEYREAKKYVDSLLVEVEFYNKENVNEFSEQGFEKWTYDEKRRLTEVKDEYSNSQDERYGYWSRLYYNENDCQYAYASSTLEYDEWIKSDSSYSEMNAFCEAEFTDHFYNEYGSMRLSIRTKIEREYDQKGNLTHFVSYIFNFENEIWDIDYEYIVEYNDLGQSVYNFSRWENGNFEHREFNTYNTFDNLKSSLRQFKDKFHKEWTNDYEILYTYNDRQLPVIIEAQYQWDTAHHMYLTYDKTEQEYDSARNIIKTLSTLTEYIPEQEIALTDLREVEYLYRCDGIVNERITKRSNANGLETQSRSVYDFYAIPDCETVKNQLDQLVIFPNPAKGYINIYNSFWLDEVELIIIDSKGSKVMQGNFHFNNYTSVDVQGLNQGLYSISIRHPDGIYSGKFIVIK